MQVRPHEGREQRGGRPAADDHVRRAEERAMRARFAIEVFAVVAVVCAVVALAIWFFFFAGSPLLPYN